MSNHPQRYYGIDELHFITCSCYRLQAWLASPQRRDLFLAVFEEVRQRYRFVVGGPREQMGAPSIRTSHLLEPAWGQAHNSGCHLITSMSDARHCRS